MGGVTPYASARHVSPILYLDGTRGVTGEGVLAALSDLVPRSVLRRAVARLPAGRRAPRPAREVLDDLRVARLPAPATRTVRRILRRLIWAEARAHQCAPRDVVFHQLGRPSALVTLVGVAAGIAHLRPTTILASPLLLGRRFQDHDGRWRRAVAPAVQVLTAEWPVRVSQRPVEHTTPMGAAIVTVLAQPVFPLDSREGVQ